MCLNATQTLTNKTLHSATSAITCGKLRAATGSVPISSASAPSAGQVLTATSSTNAKWETLSINTSVLGSLYLALMESDYATAKSFTSSYNVDAYIFDYNTITERSSD